MPRAFPERSLPIEITRKLAYSLSVDPVSPDFPIFSIESERQPIGNFLHGARNNFIRSVRRTI